MSVETIMRESRYKIVDGVTPEADDTGAKPHLLVVDDENGPRQALRMLLKESYDVHLASDAMRALQILQEEQIELIITDVRMPKRTGVELLREAKQLKPAVQVIIFTGYGQLETAMKAVEYGAFAYMEKPFDNQVMLETIEAAHAKYRQETERRALENLALEASRFATLGRLVSGMMHDLGSPLTVINSHIELLLMKPNRDDLTDRLETIKKQVEYCSDMARNTMSYLRHDSAEAATQPLGDLLGLCLEVAKPLFREHKVTLEADYPPDLPPVNEDPVMVRQAIMNIVSNAVQAMDKVETERTLWIEARCDEGEIILAIEDSGPGIPKEHRNSVFNTFFSTKGTSGTGLGLGVVQTVMQRCGGSVRIVDGKHGAGACFELRIPAAQG